MLEFQYLIQPPKRYTFEQPELKRWVEKYCIGLVLNLFAGKTPLNVKEIRNDINPGMPADYHMDGYEFIKYAIKEEMKFDTVILDPPYNLRKAREKYNNSIMSPMKKIKDKLPNVISPGGRVISLGYDTVGMSHSRGFEKLALCVVCHSGDHNDTLVIVEKDTCQCNFHFKEVTRGRYN